MKKRKNQVIFLTITVIILSSLFTTVNAHNFDTDICGCDAHDKVEYSHSSDMDSEKAAVIIHALYNSGDYNNETLTMPKSAAVCASHIIQRGYVDKTEHYYYSDSPKCRVTTSDVEYCTRSECSYFNVIRETIQRVGCH